MNVATQAPTAHLQTSVASLRSSVHAAAAVTLFWLVLRLAFAAHLPRPTPVIHDEFSYLLGADTFAHGRLANPQHPLSEFFESPHINVRPTYVSKYPPGQALFLALGQVVFGSPFWGVIISGAAMMFCCTLMLGAWVRLRWAVAVTIALAIYMQPPMYWVNSYWGGCVAACGGALVIFAIGRHWNSQWNGAGAVGGLGAAILLMSRPFEGAAMSAAAVALYLFVLTRRHNETTRINWAKVLAPAALVLAAGVVFVAIDNHAVTGNYTRLPYAEHDHQYSAAPAFWFLPLRNIPEYHAARVAAQEGPNGFEVQQWRLANGSLRERVMRTVDLVDTLRYMLGPTAILLVFVPFALRSARVRYIAGLALLGFLCLFAEVFHFAHYAAPFLAVFVVLGAVAAEHLATIGFANRRIGFAPVYLLLLLATAAYAAYDIHKLPATSHTELAESGSIRRNVLAELAHKQAPQLVIVRYPSPSWDVSVELVFNGADIDSQHVVFAHDLGQEKNRELLRYYPNRQAWLLLPKEDGKYALQPYQG